MRDDCVGYETDEREEDPVEESDGDDPFSDGGAALSSESDCSMSKEGNVRG